MLPSPASSGDLITNLESKHHVFTIEDKLFSFFSVSQKLGWKATEAIYIFGILASKWNCYFPPSQVCQISVPGSCCQSKPVSWDSKWNCKYLIRIVFRQVSYDASVDIYLTCRTIHDARPGVWSSPDNILALYKAVQTFISQHTTQKHNQNGESQNLVYWYFRNTNITFKVRDLLQTEGKIRKLLLKYLNQNRFTFEAFFDNVFSYYKLNEHYNCHFY